MEWHHLYLIIGIAALLVSMWKLARGARVLHYIAIPVLLVLLLAIRGQRI